LHKESDELESVASRLVINPVLSIKWESVPKASRARSASSSREFCIRDIYLSESYWDYSGKAEIVLAGHGKNPSKLRIVVGDPFSIHLKDVAGKK
jgi:hypothetical protein